MGWFLKFLAVVITIGLISWIFGSYTKYVFLVAGVCIALLFLVRVGAILYWWGKDKGQW